MESNGGRAGTQPYPSHGADTSGQNNSIYHEGLDRRGESRNHCARTTGVTKDKQNIRELQQRKLKLAALTISGEAKADDHTFLEVRISQCDSGYQQLTLLNRHKSRTPVVPVRLDSARSQPTNRSSHKRYVKTVRCKRNTPLSLTATGGTLVDRNTQRGRWK
jgi:hypothetical protein